MSQIVLDKTRIYINKHRNGEKPIMIHGLSSVEFERLAKLLNLEVRSCESVRWVSLPTARDKTKVYFFEGDEK